MNYPIFNSDYEFTLEEMVRYVRYFNKHRATVVVPSFFKSELIFYTYHQYREDGLLIRMEWKAKNNYFTSNETTVEELFKMHKAKTCKLMNYKIISFTENRVFKSSIPNEEVRTLFFKKVLQGKMQKMFSKEKYEILEFNVKKSNEIPEIFFEFLVEEVQKNIDFKNYLNKNN